MLVLTVAVYALFFTMADSDASVISTRMKPGRTGAAEEECAEESESRAALASAALRRKSVALR